MTAPRTITDSEHVCAMSRTCECSIDGLEPKESCPVHGHGSYPPRCGTCGKFIKWESAAMKEASDGE